MSRGAHSIDAKVLAKNSLWNLTGQALPLVAAVLAIPHLIRMLGNERFGVLTIAWMIIGYFSLLDFGIGRATIKSAATHVASGRRRYIPRLLVTSLVLLGTGGILGGIVMAVAAEQLVETVFVVPRDLVAEAQGAMYWLAASLPVVLAAAAPRGILEAQQRFGTVNVIRATGNAAVFLVPLVLVPFVSNVEIVVAVLVLSRVIVLLGYMLAARQRIHRANWFLRGHIADVRRLLRFGFWLAVTTAAGAPMAMGYIDRTVISAFLGVGALTYYATPFEVATKLWLIPAALTGVLFPAFVQQAVSDTRLLVRLHWRAVKFIFLSIAPLAMLMIIFSDILLDLWLGKEFSEKAAFTLRMLAVGVLFNSLAYVPFSAVQALGRADLTAKRHLVELPVYVAAMYASVSVWGINGAAFTWAMWAAVDMVIMFAMMNRLVPIHEARRDMRIDAVGLCGLMAGLMAYGGALVDGWVARLLIGAVILVGMSWFSWRVLLDQQEKTLLMSLGGFHAGK